MISKTDIEIYSEIFQQKLITEKYLGYVSFDWIYSSLKYTADCTLAIPFDLFDKVIVGILSIDEVLSIEQIGEILGMNLIHNPEKQQYKDEAEYDILRIALDNLKDYNMIEIGDTSYSSCRLTKDGNIFASKGHKFKVEENKPFILFFDHTSNNHQSAKKELETLKGKPVQLKTEFDFLDEVLMQNIAEVQMPEIHNPKFGNSFINPRIDTRNSASFVLKVAAALLFDVETKQTRFIAFDPSSKKTNQYITDFLNLNKRDILNLFEQGTEEGILIETKSSFLQGLIQDKTKIQSLLSSKPQDAMLVSKVSNTNSEFIDQEYFWLNLKDFISKDTEEIFILVSEATELSILKIKQLAEDKETPSLFVVFQQSSEEAVNNKIRQLYDFSSNTDNQLFVAVYSEVNSFECLLKGKRGITQLNESYLDFVNEEVHFSKILYRNQQTTLTELPPQYSEIKKTFANDYLKIIEDAVDEICEDEIEDDTINKKFILEQNSIAAKANTFLNIEIESGAKSSLGRLNTIVEKHITGIKNRHKLFLAEKLLKLSNSFEENTSDKLEDIIQFESKLNEIEVECFDDSKDIKSAINVFKEKVQSEIKRIKDEIFAKTYIIDTNVFAKYPDIISKLDDKCNIVLHSIVLEDLKKIETTPETEENVNKAIKTIEEIFELAKSSKKSRVRKARANLILLPKELQIKTLENSLLSIGIANKENNPILLTIDKRFQLKAANLGIPLITVHELLGINNEFLGRKKVVKIKAIPIVEKDTKIDFSRIFNQIKPNKTGKILVSVFISEVKKQNPTFDFKKLGFENIYHFIRSLEQFLITEGKYLKLK